METAPANDNLTNAADREEILSRCGGGDYLGAALLAASGTFAGLADCDPCPEALLVAHHVSRGSSQAPWPAWCHDPDEADEAAGDFPESSRLVLLAALNCIARIEGGVDPLTATVKTAVLPAFNPFPEMRRWLDDVLDAVEIPGLWEQVCRPESTRALDTYQEARKAFLERYDVGLQHRNLHAAYIHRQDNYVSRLPATRLLHDHLKPDEPGPLNVEDEHKIRDLLETQPKDITANWLQSAVRPTPEGFLSTATSKRS